MFEISHNVFWNTVFKLVALSILYYMLRGYVFTNEGFLKFAVVDIVGYPIKFGIEAYIIYNSLRQKRSVSRVSLSGMIRFGALSTLTARLFSSVILLIMANSLLPDLAPMMNTTSFILIPGAAFVGAFTGALIGGVSGLFLQQ